MASQKWGATALSGHLRQGLAEIRAAAPFGDSPIAQPTNYAMPGMATPGEITEARREDSVAIEESVSTPGFEQASRDDRNRDDRGMDID